MARSTEDVVLALGVLNTDLAEFAASLPMRENGILVHRSPHGPFKQGAGVHAV